VSNRSTAPIVWTVVRGMSGLTEQWHAFAITINALDAQSDQLR
jgi:hypothetical protein